MHTYYVYIYIYIYIYIKNIHTQVFCIFANSNRHTTPNSQKHKKQNVTHTHSVHVCVPHADGTHCGLPCIVHRTRPWCARAPVRLRAWCDCAPTVVARMARAGSSYSAYIFTITRAHLRMCPLNRESIYRIRCLCCPSFRVATHH